MGAKMEKSNERPNIFYILYCPLKGNLNALPVPLPFLRMYVQLNQHSHLSNPSRPG